MQAGSGARPEHRRQKRASTGGCALRDELSSGNQIKRRSLAEIGIPAADSLRVSFFSNSAEWRVTQVPLPGGELLESWG